MMVWKMIILFQGCILRFHVNLLGCNLNPVTLGFTCAIGIISKKCIASGQWAPCAAAAMAALKPEIYPSGSIHTVDGRNPANQFIVSLFHYLQDFLHTRWCRISSINSMSSKINLFTPRKVTWKPPKMEVDGRLVSFSKGSVSGSMLILGWSIPSNAVLIGLLVFLFHARFSYSASIEMFQFNLVDCMKWLGIDQTLVV